MNVMTAKAEAARQFSNIESFLIRIPRSRIGEVERDVSLSEVREVHSTFAEQAEASKQPKGGESPHVIELPIGISISIWLAAGVTDSRLSDGNSSAVWRAWLRARAGLLLGVPFNPTQKAGNMPEVSMNNTYSCRSIIQIN